MKDILTVKKLLMLGGTCSVVGILIASANTSNPYIFTFGYAVLEEFGSGINYLVPLICVWEWFPDRKGTYGGFLIASCGFSAFIFSLLTT